MATVPVPHTWSAGDYATSTALQTLTDSLLWWMGSATSTGAHRPLLRVRNTVGFSLATSGTPAAIPLDTEDSDTDSWHSTVTNTSRFTAQTAGRLRLAGQAQFAANATGVRVVFLALNGAELVGTRTEVAAASGTLPTCIATVPDVIPMVVGDYVELWANQTSGGALAGSSALLVGEWVSN